MKQTILVLAGTSEAKQICKFLSESAGLEVIASVSGVVNREDEYPTALRIGGFGGASGLIQYIQENSITLLVDATHPFATQITANSCQASTSTGIPYIRLERPCWLPEVTDNWTQADELVKLIALLPPGSTVFAPMGSGMFRSQNKALLASRDDVQFIVRSMNRPNCPLPSNVAVDFSRPHCSASLERDFLLSIGATCMMCRDSGGTTGKSKILAARILSLPIFLLQRPSLCPLPPMGLRAAGVDAVVSAVMTGS